MPKPEFTNSSYQAQSREMPEVISQALDFISDPLAQARTSEIIIKRAQEDAVLTIEAFKLPPITQNYAELGRAKLAIDKAQQEWNRAHPESKIHVKSSVGSSPDSVTGDSYQVLPSGALIKTTPATVHHQTAFRGIRNVNKRS
jgi:hypothetical protein